MSAPTTLWRSPSGRPIESTLQQIIRDGRVAAGYARWPDPVAAGAVASMEPYALHTIAGPWDARGSSLHGVRIVGLPDALSLSDGQRVRVEGCMEPGPTLAFRAFAVQALDRAPERACGGFRASIARSDPAPDGNHSNPTDAFFGPDGEGAALVMIDGTRVRERNRQARGESVATTIAGYCRSRTDPSAFGLMDDAWPLPLPWSHDRRAQDLPERLATLTDDVHDALYHRDESEVVDGLIALLRPGGCLFVCAGQSRVYHVRGGAVRVVAWEHTLARSSADPAAAVFANVILSTLFPRPHTSHPLPPSQRVELLPGDHLVFVAGRSMRALPDEAVADWVARPDFDAAARAFENASGEDTWCLARVTWTGEPDRGEAPAARAGGNVAPRTWARMVRSGDLHRGANAASPAWIDKHLREMVPVCVTARYERWHLEYADFEELGLEDARGVVNGEQYRVEGWCIPRGDGIVVGFNGPILQPFAIEAVARPPARTVGGLALSAARSTPPDATQVTRPFAPPLGPFDVLAAPHADGVLLAVVATRAQHLLRAAFRRSLSHASPASLFCLEDIAEGPSPTWSLPPELDACLATIAAGLRALDPAAEALVLHVGPAGVWRNETALFRALRVRGGRAATLPAQSAALAADERLTVLFGEHFVSMPEAALAGCVASGFERLVEAARANEQAASTWGALSVERVAPPVPVPAPERPLFSLEDLMKLERERKP